MLPSLPKEITQLSALHGFTSIHFNSLQGANKYLRYQSARFSVSSMQVQSETLSAYIKNLLNISISDIWEDVCIYKEMILPVFKIYSTQNNNLPKLLLEIWLREQVCSGNLWKQILRALFKKQTWWLELYNLYKLYLDPNEIAGYQDN